MRNKTNEKKKKGFKIKYQRVSTWIKCHIAKVVTRWKQRKAGEQRGKMGIDGTSQERARAVGRKDRWIQFFLLRLARARAGCEILTTFLQNDVLWDSSPRIQSTSGSRPFIIDPHCKKKLQAIPYNVNVHDEETLFLLHSPFLSILLYFFMIFYTRYL